MGTFDAAVIFGVRAIGASRSAALTYLLLLRFVLFVPITIVGLIALVTRYGGWSRLRSVPPRVKRPRGARATAPRARAAADSAV